MKKKLINFLLLVSFTFIPCYPSERDNNNSENTKTVIIEPSRNDNRPNAPAKYGLQCFYGEWFLQIEMPADAASMIVVVEQNGVIEYEGMITRGNTYMQLPVLSGCYTIRCETDTHQFFTGVITF